MVVKETNVEQTQTVLVIFGIMGDLSRRKLIPALVNIAEAGLLKNTRIIGITRQNLTAHDALANLPDSTINTSKIESLLEVFTMDLTDEKSYSRLWSLAQKHAKTPDTQIVHYLSVPPQAAGPIVQFLGKTKPGVVTKLMLEKPFGIDLTSAEEAIKNIDNYFDEEQVYRIDHYLAKEMTQNILTFRTQNAIFRHLWSAAYIEKIEVIAAEKIGIEGRTTFYEQTGALRDFMQNHMMQLLSLILMDIPSSDAGIPAKRQEALAQLKPIDLRNVRRGQYDGYRSEVDNADSATETMVDMTVYSAAERWQGVPIRLLTGKKLSEQTTEIRVFFKKSNASESDRLVLHVQPEQGIGIDLWVKKPGFDKTLEMASLTYQYPPTVRPVEAYERVLLDAFSSDKSLFTSAPEVLESWRLLEPVQQHWELHDDDLLIYKPGISVDELLS